MYSEENVSLLQCVSLYCFKNGLSLSINDNVCNSIVLMISLCLIFHIFNKKNYCGTPNISSCPYNHPAWHHMDCINTSYVSWANVFFQKYLLNKFHTADPGSYTNDPKNRTGLYGILASDFPTTIHLTDWQTKKSQILTYLKTIII